MYRENATSGPTAASLPPKSKTTPLMSGPQPSDTCSSTANATITADATMTADATISRVREHEFPEPEESNHATGEPTPSLSSISCDKQTAYVSFMNLSPIEDALLREVFIGRFTL